MLKKQSGGIRPNAIIPEPKIADKDKSEVCRTALIEFRNNSGAADPKATKVTAVHNINKIKAKTRSTDLQLLLGP